MKRFSFGGLLIHGPRVEQRDQVARLKWVKRIFVLTLVAFAFRFWQIQIRDRELYIAKVDEIADRMSIEKLYLDPPSRGLIRDRNGLAVTGIRKIRGVWVAPEECRSEASYEALMELVHEHFPERTLEEWKKKIPWKRFDEKLLESQYLKYAHVAYAVPDEVWRAIHNDIQSRPGWTPAIRSDLRDAVQEDIYNRRDYPHGRLAGHILGYTSRNPSVQGGFLERGAVGSGLEYIFDTTLTGAYGVRETEWNRKRHIRLRSATAQHGEDIWTTLDLWIQSRAEYYLDYLKDLHNPDKAAIMVTEPQTGKILAIASYPSLDPREFNDFLWGLREDEPEWIPTIAFQDHFAPGSTFKVITMASGFDAGVVELDEPIDCMNGSWGRPEWGGNPIREAFHHRYGVLTASQIIQKSSNIGVARIVVERMGRDLFYDYLHRFGFGERTGARVAGEIGGRIIPSSRAMPIDVSRMAFGQAMSVTGMQLMMAYGAIANGGVMMSPMIIEQQVLSDGSVIKTEPLARGRVISEKAARDITTAMKTVCEPGGTGTLAQIDEYKVAGKTGTAQIIRPGQGVQYTGSFMGFYPADAPRICLGIVVMNPKRTEFTQGSVPYTGGRVAGETFQNFGREIGKYLKIPEVSSEEEEETVEMARSSQP